MRITFTGIIVLLFLTGINAQHNHLKELGLKGKIKKLTCIYYAEGVIKNNTWVAKDSAKFAYKTITYYNRSQFIDSVQTYVSHSSKEKLLSVKRYTYDKNNMATGTEYNYLDDLNYSLTIQWLDKNTYIEQAKDASGKNSMNSKIYLDNQFHIIKREDQLYRDGELFDHSITETKFNPDNTEHALSITENKINNMEFSMDEYVDQRDSNGNPIKKSYKDGINSYRSIKYFIIEYSE